MRNGKTKVSGDVVAGVAVTAGVGVAVGAGSGVAVTMGVGVGSGVAVAIVVGVGVAVGVGSGVAVDTGAAVAATVVGVAVGVVSVVDVSSSLPQAVNSVKPETIIQVCSKVFFTGEVLNLVVIYIFLEVWVNIQCTLCAESDKKLSPNSVK